MDTVIYKKFHWLNIVDPNHKDLDKLKKKYRFHQLDLEDCLSEIQRPKIDEYSKYMFIVLHFPIYNERTKFFTWEELDIFLGKNYIITLHDGKLAPLNNLFKKVHQSAKQRELFLKKGTGYLLYEICRNLFDYCFPLVDKIHYQIRNIEGSIFESETSPGLLKNIMIIKKNIITIRRILMPQRQLIASLEHKISGLDIYFDDIVDKIEKLWSNLETSKEVIDSLQETYESLMTHSMNNVMKTLTVFSVVMLPLTFITGLYGMNVHLPFSNLGWIFTGLIGCMITIIGIMLGIFKYKKWL